jgi:cysteinyl-tRNA synthetase
MATYWMHNGFLQVEGEKMSKSLGNFVTIHELLHTEKFGGRKWPGEVLRLAMLRTHYRQPIDWTVKALEEAETALRRWSEFIQKGETLGNSVSFPHEFAAALADDLNTPLAASLLHDCFDPLQLDVALKLLGVDARNYAGWIESEKRQTVDASAIESRISARLAARVAKNWAESDRIRDELAAMGVVLKDNKDGTTTWEVKR